MQTTFDMVFDADTGEVLFANLDVVAALPFLPEEIASQAAQKMATKTQTKEPQQIVLMEDYNPILLANCEIESLGSQCLIKLRVLDVRFKSKHVNRLKILVVDDNLSNRKLLDVILKRLGTEVVCATDGYDALEQAGTNLFDIIFMDINMPGISGIQTTRKIRALPNGKLPYIVATTALSSPEGTSKFLRCGMNGTLNKPLSADAVKSKITDLLHSNQVSNLPTVREQASNFSELEKLAMRISFAM